MGKSLPLIIALVYTVVLSILSLVSLTNIVDAAPEFSDKIAHFFLYALLCLLWFRALSNYLNNKTRALLWASLTAIIFGIIIEALQGSITTTRSSDYKDVIANILGVTFVTVVLCFKKNFEVKK